MEIVRPVRGVEFLPVRSIRRSIGLRDQRAERGFQDAQDRLDIVENGEDGSANTLHNNAGFQTLGEDGAQGPSDRIEVGEAPTTEALVEHINISRDRGHPDHRMTSALLKYGLSLEQIAALSMRTA